MLLLSDNVIIENTPGLSDWIGVGLTAVLILVTLWYAKHARDTVQEMRLTRRDDRESRRREKSDRAAYECLAILRDLSDEMSFRGPSAIEPERLAIVRRTLKGEGALIDDTQIRDRLFACAEVLRIGSLDNFEMKQEELSPGQVAVLVHQIVIASRQLVEAYLAERPFNEDMWRISGPQGNHNLPSCVDAKAWVYRLGGQNT